MPEPGDLGVKCCKSQPGSRGDLSSDRLTGRAPYEDTMNPQALHQLREGKADCPSDLQLDRLHAGELGTEAAQQLNAHITGCDACPSRMQARRSGFDAFTDRKSVV